MSQSWRHGPTIGAAVVEELDDGDIALGVAADRRIRIVQQVVPAVRQLLTRLLRGCEPLPFPQYVQNVENHLRVFQEIIPDDAFERLPFFGCKNVVRRGDGSTAERRRREQKGRHYGRIEQFLHIDLRQRNLWW